jgi:uncharacterized protein
MAPHGRFPNVGHPRSFRVLSDVGLCYCMQFEWDEAKNEANQQKHGFDFATASRIFNGPIRQSIDPRLWGERRIVATGTVEGRFITVVYTLREGRCRVISARPARRNERF